MRRLLVRGDDAAPTEVLEAADARTGLALLAHARPDAVLLDYYLPDADGLEVLAALREAGRPSTPVILLTGAADEALALRALQLGAQDYLLKDEVTAVTLRRALAHAIAKERLLAELEASRREAQAAAEDAQRQAARLDVLLELGRRVIAAEPERDVILGIVREVVRARLGDQCVVCLPAATGPAAVLACAATDPAALGPFQRFLAAGRPGLLEQVRVGGPACRLSRAAGGSADAGPDEIESAVLAPLRGRDAGVLAAFRARGGRPYDEHDERLLTGVAEYAALALDNPRLQEAAREVRAFLEQMIACSPVGMAILDTDLRLVRVNEALARLNGAPAEAHLGRTAEEVLPALLPALGARLGDLASGGPPIVQEQFEARTPDRRGAPAQTLTSCYPVRAPSGETLGYGLVVVDITAQKAAEADLRALAADNARLYRDARAAVALRERVLSVVSHDLRCPLHAVVLQHRLLGLRAANDPGLAWLQGPLARLDGATARMTAMLGDLVDTARLQAGGALTLDLQPTDLAGLVGSVVEEAAHGAGGRVVQVGAGGAGIVGAWDRARLQSVLENLVSNALKYSPAEAPEELSCGLGAGAGGAPEAWLSVRDQGIGIPAADLPHVFDWFSRASNVQGRIEGTGVGLASARLIVEQHGGRITVESREGEGARFTVHLPLGR